MFKLIAFSVSRRAPLSLPLPCGLNVQLWLFSAEMYSRLSSEGVLIKCSPFTRQNRKENIPKSIAVNFQPWWGSTPSNTPSFSFVVECLAINHESRSRRDSFSTSFMSLRMYQEIAGLHYQMKARRMTSVNKSFPVSRIKTCCSHRHVVNGYPVFIYKNESTLMNAVGS